MTTTHVDSKYSWLSDSLGQPAVFTVQPGKQTPNVSANEVYVR